MTNADRLRNGYPARPERMSDVAAWLEDGCTIDGRTDPDGRRAWLLGKATAALMLANTEIARLEREVHRLSVGDAELEQERAVRRG